MASPFTISRAGNQGGSFQSYDFTEPGKYLITGSYEHVSIPDTTIVKLDGETIGFSGTFQSGPGLFADSFQLGAGETAKLSFIVDAPLPGTAWNYTATVTYLEPEPPVARDDNDESFRVDSSFPLDILVSKLLANDSDPNNDIDPTSLAIASQPTHGTVSVASGVVTYRPDYEALEAEGRDSFTYTVSDETGKVSNTATVYIEGPCSPPHPYTITGGTVEELGDGKCRMTGNFHIGRTDGNERLVLVQGGVAEYDKDKLEILSGTFFSAVGPAPIEMFTLTSPLTFIRNQSGASDLVLPEQGDVALGGVPFKIASIALDKTEIDLGGALTAPEVLGGQEISFGGLNALGGANLGAKVSALSIGAEGVSIESGEITLKDQRFKAFDVVDVKSEGVKFTFSDNASSVLPDLTVNGKLTISQELVNTGKTADGAAKESIGSKGVFIDLLNPNFLKIADGEIDGSVVLGANVGLKAESGWGINNIGGQVIVNNNEIIDVSASASIAFPELTVFKGGIKGIDGTLGFVTKPSLAVDDLIVTLSGEIPMGASGVFLTKFGGGFQNIQPDPPGGIGVNRPLIFQGTLGLGLGPTLTVEPVDPLISPAGEITFRTFAVEMTGGLRKERSDAGSARAGDLSITANATASLVAPEILKAEAAGTLNLSQGTIDVSKASITSFGGIFTGNGSLKGAVASGDIQVKAVGQIKVPDIPLAASLRGKVLNEAGLEAFAIGSSYGVQAWKPIVIPVIGAKDIVVRYDSASGFSFSFGTKPAPLVGSWEMQGDEDWLEMTASWENAAGRDVALRVTYQETVGGPVVESYEKADFEAAGIVAPLDFSGEFGRSVFVNDPRAGVWDVEVIDPTGLGAIAYDGSLPVEKPEITLIGAERVAGAPGAPAYEITYEAFDGDSEAEIVFYVDTDGEGFDGTPLGDIGVVAETDGAGVVTFSTEGFPAGAQFVYAMIMDGDSAPVFSGYLGPLDGRAATDLALEGEGPGAEVEQGGWASYNFVIENLGPETAIDGTLELVFSNLTFEPAGFGGNFGPVVIDPTGDSFFDQAAWRLLDAGPGVTQLGWSRLDTFTTGPDGEVVSTRDGDWMFSLSLAPLAPGASRTLDIQFMAPDAGAQDLAVEATVSSAGWETDVSNDTVTLFTDVVTRQAPAADLSLERIAPNYAPGEEPNGDYDYAYVITNNSLDAAEAVTLTIDLGPEIPLPSGLRDFQLVPAYLFAGTPGFTSIDNPGPWTTVQENYRSTITFNRPIEGGETVYVPIGFRPQYDWLFDEIATLAHAGVDIDTSNNVATGALDLPAFVRQPSLPPAARVRIEANNYEPAVDDEIIVTARFDATDDVGGQLFRVTLPSGVELVRNLTTITIGNTSTTRPVSNEVTFEPDPDNPGSYLWQLASVEDTTGRALLLTLKVLDAAPQPVTIEMISSPQEFSNATPGDGVIGDADDATLILNDPGGPPPPPDNSISTPPFVNISNSFFGNPLPPITEGQFFSYTFSAAAFQANEPGDTLTISMDFAPDWLTFDPDTLTISGTPDEPKGRSVRMRATDQEGEFDTGNFSIRVTNTPDAPVIANQIADQTAKVGATYSLLIQNPTNVGTRDTFDTLAPFGDPDYLAENVLTINGTEFVYERDFLTLSFSGLPEWLALDDSNPQSLVLRGLPFADDLGETTITVTATDIFGLTETMTFDVDVVANEDPAEGFIVTVGAGYVVEGDSGSGLLPVTIARFGDVSGAASVSWTVEPDGVAPVDGRDFGGRLPSGVAEFAPGQTSATIELRVRGDMLAEDDEGLEIVLSDAIGAPIALERARAKIINDDDAPQLGVTSGVGTVVRFDARFQLQPFSEGDEGITDGAVLLRREGDLSGTTRVSWRLEHYDTDPGDFGGITPGGVVTFLPGQATAEMLVPISGDSIVELTSGETYYYDPDFGGFGAYVPDWYSEDDGYDIFDIEYYEGGEAPDVFEYFGIVIDSVEGGEIGDRSIDGLIVNDDPIQTIDAFWVEVALIDPDPFDPGGVEGTPFTFEVRTDDFGAYAFANTIAWEIVGVGAAPADADDFDPAVLASGVAEIPVGDVSTTITVNIAQDLIGEEIERFAIVLKPFDALSSLDTRTGAAIATILNDDYGLRDDAASTPEGEAVSIDLLGNDVTPPGGDLALSALGAAANGVVTFGAEGAAVYTPTPGFSGVDTFSYDAKGGDGATRTATVTVTVGAAAAGVEALDDSAATLPGDTVEVDVLVNDRAAGAGPLSISHFGYAGSGAVERTGDGKLRYTPAAGFEGFDAITYVAGDGTSEASATLTVSVGNRAPIIQIDARESAVGDRSPEADIAVADILLADDGIGEHAFALSGPDAALFALRGQMIFLRAGAQLEGLSGDTLAIEVSVDDALLPGGPEDTKTFTLDVIPAANSAPLANDDFARVYGPGPQIVDLLENDRDFDGDPVTLVSISAVAKGSAQIVDGKLVYTPFGGASGDDVLTYEISDGRDTATGEARIRLLDLEVGDNTPPVALGDAFSVSADAGPTALGSVLANDTDANFDTLAVASAADSDGSAISLGAPVALPEGGVLTLNGDGSIVFDPSGAFGALNAGADAAASISVTVTDGQGGTNVSTATVTITGVNDAPVATSDTGLTISGAFTVIDALANDSDPEGAVLVLTGLTQPGNGVAVLTNDGRIAYRAASDFVGTDSFDYIVGDGAGGTATGQVDVDVVPETAPGIGTAAAQIVALLYEAGLNRNGAIDAGGLNFWIDAREGGFTPRQLGNAFLGSGEFEAAFGAPDTLTDQDLVEVLFRNVLDREGEAGGVNFWTTVVGQPGFTRSDLLLAFAASPENLAGSAAVGDLTETAPGTWDFV